MKQQLIALALSTALLAGSAAAIAPEEAFPAVNTYPGFADVAGSAWYAATVQTCYEVGLMTGTGAGFAPDQVLTVGEVAAIAARMNEAITGDSIYLVDSTLPWYASYVDYLEKLGVEVPDPVKQATRQEFIAMLAAVVPEDMLTPINQITALPDTADAAVLSFYNAGILTGVDDWGTFAPDKTLTRAETAAMVARVARPELRENFSPADYAMFTAAYLKPADVLFTNGVTAGQYLPYVQTLIDGLEADCAAQGMEFNWFNTVDGVIFLDYVEDTALAHFGVTAKDGTQLYKDFSDEGVEVSGGEAQKIAIARALYKDAPFIILDEPTAALDPIAEAEIYEKFNAISGDRTAIYISHRLSSCRFCDEIAVFSDGRVIQQGTHETLLAQETGKYAELWRAQAQYYTKQTPDAAEN